MLTTAEAFEKFRQKLELSETERSDAARRQKDVRDCIRTTFAVTTDFLSGSYGRHTKTKPLKDVDAFFVLGDAQQWRRKKPANELLRPFAECLKKQYTEAGQVQVSRRSVTVEFAKSYYPEDHHGKILSIDAVPSFECGEEQYEIPDRVDDKWIKTNPARHKEQATAKNDQLDGHWVPLVKMAKAWNRTANGPIKPSFLIEVMARELVEAPFSSYEYEMRNFFAAMAENLDRVWPDPAALGPAVSDQMKPENISKARNALQDAQRKAALAARAEQTGRQGDALQIWREILGDYFPLS